MSDQKPTGVFVRLPLSDEQAHDLFVAATTPVHTKTLLEGCLIAIGTPVTGGELEDIDIVDAAYGNSDAKYVRQSDALAKLAEKDAELARLNQKITKLEDIIAGALLQSCLHGADGDIGRLRRVEAELKSINALKGGVA